jgi:hypothetical protein
VLRENKPIQSKTEDETEGHKKKGRKKELTRTDMLLIINT